jgi:hypothetical protein
MQYFSNNVNLKNMYFCIIAKCMAVQGITNNTLKSLQLTLKLPISHKIYSALQIPYECNFQHILTYTLKIPIIGHSFTWLLF